MPLQHSSHSTSYASFMSQSPAFPGLLCPWATGLRALMSPKNPTQSLRPPHPMQGGPSSCEGQRYPNWGTSLFFKMENLMRLGTQG